MPTIDCIDHGDRIREIRLARPPVNALDPELLGALHAALVESHRNPVEALILSGAPRVFSAGLDLPALLQLPPAALTDFWKLLIETLQTIAQSPIPILAAITGHSPAGGTVLTLFADYRIQARGDFRIGLNEVQVGLPVPACIYRGLVRLIGIHPAERLATQGLLISPDQALQLGLIDELADPEAVGSRALELARTWVCLPTLAFRETRRIARQDLATVFGDQDEPAQLTELWFRPETQEALKASVRALKERAASGPQARLRST